MVKKEKNLEAFTISSIEEIFNNDQSDLKQAVNFYIKECKKQIISLKNINFTNYEKLSQLNAKLSSLNIIVFEDEKALNKKDSDNPRELRDTIKDNEELKAEIAINLKINKDSIDTLTREINDLSKTILKIDNEIDALHSKIKAAKEYYKNKASESNQ